MENIKNADITDLLRAYQWDGVNFLIQQKACLLADEMGLGKTVQAAVALSLIIPKSSTGRALIVVPAALRINWEKELDRWAPKLSVRRLEGDIQERLAHYNLPINILIGSYEQIRQDAIFLSDMVNFDVIVLDEAQRIKNINSSTSLAVRTLKRNRSWAMTGTPVENSADDLFAIFRFVKLGLLNQAMNRVEMHRTMQPYFMRRLKKNVLQEMPPIILQDIPIELSQKQKEAYLNIWNNRDKLVMSSRKRISNTAIFALITKLKKVCNYDEVSGDSSKMDALNLIVDNLSTDDKVIVFSQYVETLKFISNRLKDKVKHDIYHGGLNEKQRNTVIEQFKEGRGPRVLLMSLKAGGVGLNLQEASSIVLFDRWWNPASEEQAINRAHRFSRESVLHVFRFTVINSIEERIVNILEKKQLVFERYINQADIADISSLSLSDLMNIIDLQIE